MIRNALCLAGAYYLSSWAVVPLWSVITRFTGNRPYHSGFEALAMDSVLLIPYVVGALLAGLAVGYVIESLRLARWAIAFGVAVAALGWLSYRWHVEPDLSQRAGQALKTLIPGFSAWAGVLAGYRYVEKRRNTSAVESGA